jgi:CHASE1-domain containing sensor protein
MSQARQHEALTAKENRWGLLVLTGPVLTVFLLGLTFMYWQAAQREAGAKRHQAFTVSVDRIVSSLKDRMAAYELVLRGVKGYYDGSDSIEREEFQAYVQALRLPETRPGLQGVAYVLNLPADELDAHVEQMRNKGFLSYNVHPQVAQSHHPYHPHRAPVQRQPQGAGVRCFHHCHRPRGAGPRARHRQTGPDLQAQAAAGRGA